MRLSLPQLTGLRVFASAAAARAVVSARYASTSTSASTSADAIPTETPSTPTASTPSENVVEMRLKAIKLYKEGGINPNYEFNKRLRRAFEKNSKTTDPAALQKQLELGEHIKKEVLALISLKKFRHLRRTYHANEAPR